MHQFYLSFHVDKFHLKPKNKKDLDISQKIPAFLKKYQRIPEQLLYIDVLLNPDNFQAAMITSPNLCLDKVIFRLGEFGNFILMLSVFVIFLVK
jgi:hypothetical protein